MSHIFNPHWLSWHQVATSTRVTWHGILWRKNHGDVIQIEKLRKRKKLELWSVICFLLSGVWGVFCLADSWPKSGCFLLYALHGLPFPPPFNSSWKHPTDSSWGASDVQLRGRPTNDVLLEDGLEGHSGSSLLVGACFALRHCRLGSSGSQGGWHWGLSPEVQPPVE